MSRLTSAGIVGWAVAMTAVVQGSAGSPVRQVIVRIYDDVGVGRSAMQTARRTGSAILRQAAIEVVWRDCPTASRQAPCEGALANNEVVVRVEAASPVSPAHSLGYARLDVQAQTGRFATVFADRIKLFATGARCDAGTLLGRVIAHEIGHMLAGSPRHSAHGIMRARWLDSEFKQDMPWEWVFSVEEVNEMHWGLLARSVRWDEPTGVQAADTGETRPALGGAPVR